MLTLRDEYIVFCECIKDEIKFEQCRSCTNYTNLNKINLNEDNKFSYCKYKDNK